MFSVEISTSDEGAALAEQAIAFAEAFGGHLIVDQTSPSDPEPCPVAVHRGREDAYAANSSLFP